MIETLIIAGAMILAATIPFLPLKKWISKNSSSKSVDIEPLKILFIDDDYQEYSLIETLKRHDEFDVRAKLDVDSFTEESIKWADVIFVDIHGVGVLLNLNEGGKDLAVGIKRQYPRKKVVLYSFDATGNIFDEDLDIMDWRIKKSRRASDVIEKLQVWKKEN